MSQRIVRLLAALVSTKHWQKYLFCFKFRVLQTQSRQTNGWHRLYHRMLLIISTSQKQYTLLNKTVLYKLIEKQTIILFTPKIAKL